MKKEERIARYGEEAYKRKLERERARYKAHPEEIKARAKKYREEHPEEIKAKKLAYNKEHREEEKARVKKWQEEHPEEIKAKNQRTQPESCQKGGKYYDKKLVYNRTGLQGERHRIRINHAKQYRPFKQIIAPESQIHHEWVPQTDEYRGVALVEKEAHMHGFVDVIEILDGEITLLTEEEIRKGKKNEKEDI
jgi:hypothetical protein